MTSLESREISATQNVREWRGRIGNVGPTLKAPKQIPNQSVDHRRGLVIRVWWVMHLVNFGMSALIRINVFFTTTVAARIVAFCSSRANNTTRPDARKKVTRLRSR